MLEVGMNFKIERVIHTKTGNTLLYLVSKLYKKDSPYKNYSFFIDDELLPYNKGDMIIIDYIKSIDYTTRFYRGKQIVNVNVIGEVTLVSENKSAIEREVKEKVRELPF